MDSETIYQYLEELAKKLDISIRYDDMTGSQFGIKSGLCKIKGKYLYVMDTSKDVSERIAALSECLCQMDLEGIYVIPAVRELLARARNARAKGQPLT
jgi:hypothetical protein